MDLVVDVLSWVCLLGGSFFTIVGALGIVRLPDFWARLHASSVAESGGMILIILGLCLQAGWGLITVKLIIIGIFLFITGPTSTHAIANAALVTGWRPKLGKGVTQKDTPPFSDLEKPTVRG
ncbi:MAG: monovalent cation/H(+) antiporter subunit G [Pseudomonadota bacterium]